MQVQKHPGFIWADKVALFTAGGLLSLLAFCWSIAFMAIGSQGAEHLWDYLGVPGIELSLLIAGLFLVVTRGIDFASGGPTYQLFVSARRYLSAPAERPSPAPEAAQFRAFQAAPGPGMRLLRDSARIPPPSCPEIMLP